EPGRPLRVLPRAPEQGDAIRVRHSDLGRRPVHRPCETARHPAPQHLCLAANKNSEGVKNPAGVLACYIVKPPPRQPRRSPKLGVRSGNQFGALTLDTTKERELCFPSAIGLSAGYAGSTLALQNPSGPTYLASSYVSDFADARTGLQNALDALASTG